MPDIDGIPYVEPGDLVSGYPSVSQSLAQEVSDQLASKAPFAYGTATPTTDVEGFIWFDENDDPATPKYWDGTEFVPFPSGAGDAVISSPAASGNYTDDGVEYDFYTFTASGTLTVDTAGFADVLVVGGGGGGGNFRGGGGGAGGHLYSSNAYLAEGTLTVHIGAGGAGRPNSADRGPGANGITSRVGSFYAPGGGGGGGDFDGFGARSAGGAGGSGGGGGGATGDGGAVGGAGTSGQGNSGGTSGDEGGPGGGGGAGAVGANGSAADGGNGGAGLANSITGTSVTRAGGGGGGGDVFGAGGSGGGGAGGNPGVAGTANTGGGGGGNRVNDSGGNGGSGVVIVRVKV